MRAKQAAGLSAPIALLTVCWFTVEHRYRSGTESTVQYGWPLAWYEPSQVASASNSIALAPLLLTLLCWAGLTTAVVAALCRVLGLRLRPSSSRLILLLWVAAAPSLVLTIIGFSIDPVFHLWLDSSYYRQVAPERRVLFGLQPPREP